MKVALVYDRVNKWGGAERVLLALHEMFPDAPLYTAVYSKEKATWAKVFPSVIPSFLQKIPLLNRWHELLGTFTPIAFEMFDFTDFDLVISITSESAKGVITKPPTKHICICLTPTRYLWSGYDIYFKNKILRLISCPFVYYLRKWDEIAADRPDKIIAISTEVQKRIRKYYKRESEIIYPPVETKRFSKTLSNTKPLDENDYYLVVGRLVPYKRVNLVVKVFNEINKPLVIVGTGSEKGKLKNMANSNIVFTGHLTDEDLTRYYQKAKALIFPQEEDFGIVAIEAQTAGVPIIAYSKGGAIDTVIEGTTGVFFEKQDKKSLKRAIEKFEQKKFDKKAVKKNAKRFSKERFKKELTKVINNL